MDRRIPLLSPQMSGLARQHFPTWCGERFLSFFSWATDLRNSRGHTVLEMLEVRPPPPLLQCTFLFHFLGAFPKRIVGYIGMWCGNTDEDELILILFIYLFIFCFLGLHLQHTELPRLGVESELQLPAYTTAIAMWDPSFICDLHRSSWQCRILSPHSEPGIEPASSWIPVGFLTH